MMTRPQAAFPFIAVAAALGSCTQAPPPGPSRPIGINRSLAEVIANLPPGGTTTTVVYATIDLSCSNGKTYTVSTGTNGGRCDVHTYEDKPKSNHAICTDGGSGAGAANCTEGCVSSEGAGSCSVKPTR